jgi:hypothetical protein
MRIGADRRAGGAGQFRFISHMSQGPFPCADPILSSVPEQPARASAKETYMRSIRKAVAAGGLVVATMTGGAIGASLLTGTASAQTSTTTPAPASAPDPSQGGHKGANGVVEALLTGDTAAKAKAAALAAVPGGTVQRVENDAEGAVYEAHMLKSDGSPVTVKMDAAFAVTGIETGGPGGH